MQFIKTKISIVLLFRVNVGCGPAEERVLLTGLHAVADIYCECCKTTLGWKYVSCNLFISSSSSFSSFSSSSYLTSYSLFIYFFWGKRFFESEKNLVIFMPF